MRFGALMMRLDVAFLPPAAVPACVVVFDVLRMTTTACALFDAGVSALTVVADPDEARKVAAERSALLLGERQGVALPGFDGGNSPLEVAGLVPRGREAVQCTTNGSRAVEAAAAAEGVFLGAVVNASALAEALLAAAPDEVLLVCAGTEGRPSLDDVVGAACTARALAQRDSSLELSDAAHMALRLLEGPGDLRALVGRAAHARFLERIGFGDDVAFAADLDALRAVPWRKAGRGARFTAWPAGPPTG